MVKTRRTRTLTDQQKWRIIHLYKQKTSIAAIARECKHSIRAVRRWVERYNTSGGIDIKPKPGRKPILTMDPAQKILDCLVEGQRGGSRGVASFLYCKKVLPRVLDKNTVLKYARRAAAFSKKGALKVRRGYPQKGLTSDTKQKRLSFAVEKLSMRWDLVMFTDRKRFYNKYPGSAVRNFKWYQEKDKHAVDMGVYMPNNPSNFNVYAGITIFGATSVHEVAGSTGYKSKHMTKGGLLAKNITSDQYKEVLLKTLLPQGKKLYNRTRWYLQQDNDPTHRVAYDVVKQWNRQHGDNVQVLTGWPPNSPDLSPIENFWAFVEKEVFAAGEFSIADFKNRVKKEIQIRTAERMAYFKSLYKSMPKRLSKTIANVGGKSGY